MARKDGKYLIGWSSCGSLDQFTTDVSHGKPMASFASKVAAQKYIEKQIENGSWSADITYFICEISAVGKSRSVYEIDWK